jgi:hypothetical protein
VVKAYAIPFVGAVSATLLGVAIWAFVQPQQEPGLLWGGKVYTTEAEFKGYLKSKGLSYKVWLARYPGAAPWEPDVRAKPAPSGTKSGREAALAPSREPHDDWAGRLQLALLGALVASGCTLSLLLWRLRRRFKVPGVRIGIIGARARRGGGSSRRRGIEAIKRLGRLTGAWPRRLGSSLVVSAERLLGAARGDAGLLPRLVLPKLVRQRNISVGDVAFAVLMVMAAGMFALYVALLLSA